jgi:hypothetical protein
MVSGPAGPGQKRLNIFNLLADFASPFIRQAQTQARTVCAEKKVNYAKRTQFFKKSSFYNYS